MSDPSDYSRPRPPTPMNNPPNPAAAKLRRLAEACAREQAPSPADLPAPPPADWQQTLHELRVHQIELEMQNAELHRAQAELTVAKDRYFDLYDLAPVGYLTLGDHGLILEVNLAAAALLGVPRKHLVRQQLARFISREDQDAYFLKRQQLFATGTPLRFDLRLVKPNGTTVWAHLRATAAREADGTPVARFVLSDITERKRADAAMQTAHAELEQQVAERTAELSQANAALQANHLFARETLRLARLAGWKANPHTDYLEWTDGIFEIIEVPKGRQPGLAEWLKFYLPEHISTLNDAITRCLDTGEQFALECRGTTGTGRMIWTEVRGFATAGSGSDAYVLGTLQDITERKQTELKLRQLSAAVEQSSTSIAITNLDGNIEYVNPEFCALTGYTLAELLGKNPRVLQSGQTSPATYRELWATLTAGHAWRGDFCNRKKSGELYWEAVAIAPIRDAAGQVTHYVGVKNDITELHRLQEALRKSQEEFRAIADYTVDWELWFGPDGKILWMNPAVERITGYTPAEMLAQPDFLAAFVAPVDYDLCAATFQGALGGSRGNDLECRCVHKNEIGRAHV